MISAHYMQEIQRDNERNIKRAVETRRYTRDIEGKHARPGFIPRLINGTGSVLIDIGTRLQCFSAYRQVKI